MSDIFISYASEDRARTKVLAGSLECQGWSVWWDRKILPGQRFAKTIKKELDKAKCIIVLWSKWSVESDWVQDEAAEGNRRKILVPAKIDDVDIPLGFKSIQTARLVDWDGKSPHPEFDTLLEAISAILGQPLLPKASEPTPDEQQTENKIQTVPKDKPKDDKATDSITQKHIKKLPPSFCNPFELDAEYILIPGGRYKYQGKTETEVPNIYFAKYLVTNRLYRRFIRYNEGKEQELLKILPKGEFDKRISEFVWGLGLGIYKYLKRPPNISIQPEDLCSSYDTDKRFNGEDQPALGMTWATASIYCYWLCLLEAVGENLSYDKAAGLYRLPNEVEWEWAAGGGERKYPWASEKGEPSEKLANYDWNVGATTPVGSYPEGATPEDLMDMAGNVWEWMENWDEKDRNEHFVRGGSWHCDEFDLLCSVRHSLTPEFSDGVGFRVVRSQP